MPIFLLLLFSGILSSFWWQQLPPLSIVITSLVIFLLLIIQKPKVIKYLAVFGLGCSYALFRACLITNWSLSPSLENQPLFVEGYIHSIPIQRAHLTCFDFKAVKIENSTCASLLHLCVPNNHYVLKMGDSWHFKVKLRQPRSLMNEGTFDAQKYYFQHRIRALGTLLIDQRNHQLACLAPWKPLEKVRVRLFEMIMTQFKNDPLCGVLLALTLGITAFITQTQWEVFRQTGTNHLVAISGLHIGLMASMAMKTASFIWGRIPWGPLRIPTPYICSLAGLAAALVYSVLTGFSPSTQRAFVMVLSLCLATLLKRHITTFRSLLFALGIVLLWDPFAVISAGFWLSFMAVFLLIVGMQGRPHVNSWWRWGRAQWVVALGLMPTLILFYQQATYLSLPANLVAIPWISFLVVPISILGLFLLFISKALGNWLLHLSLELLRVVWTVLQYLATHYQLIWHFAFPTHLSLWLTELAGFIFLLPIGLIPFLFGVGAWLPCLLPLSYNPPFDKLQLVVFDVGQGLATLIRTKNHVIIFDTGAKVNDQIDMGKSVITPYLRIAGIKRIDFLVISHGDNDHIGGARSLIETFDVSHIITSVPERFTYLRDGYQSLSISPCIENQSFEIDKAKFKFLAPSNLKRLKGNNRSCVLKINFGKQSILLTGDIEKAAEKELLLRHAKDLPAKVLLVPHHGSRTSSTFNFIKTIAPTYVIFSYGYLNSYHHPHSEVINRYLEINSQLLNTVNSGAIIMTLSRDSDKVIIQEYRKNHQRIWHQ